MLLLLGSVGTAQSQMHQPWWITVDPDTIHVGRPFCSASFTVRITVDPPDYKVGPITIFVERDPSIQFYITGFLFDGTSNVPSKQPPYETTVTVLVGSTCPPGNYRLRIWAYPAATTTYYADFQVYADVTLIVEDTGVTTCLVYTAQTPVSFSTAQTPVSFSTSTTTTGDHRPWDWWNWWQWWYWDWLKWGTFDFALNATPTSQSIKAGESASYTVAVTLVSGRTQPVTLTLSQLPIGMSYSFGLSPGNPTFASGLRVSCDASLSPGTYPLTVIGTGGDKTHSAVVYLIVAKNMAESSISISATPSSVKEGEVLIAGGALSPAVATTVELVYSRPDGFEMVKHPATTSGGVFSDTFSPDTPGLWSVRARWPGDTNHYGCESRSESFSVEEKPPSFLAFLPTLGLIIIIALVIAAVALLVRRRIRRRSVKTQRRAGFCPKCKADISMEHDYCPQCGHKI
jgi:hypothetical protein